MLINTLAVKLEIMMQSNWVFYPLKYLRKIQNFNLCLFWYTFTVPKDRQFWRPSQTER